MAKKAICELTKEELASEYLYCIQAMKDDNLDICERAHYSRRAEAIKQEILFLNYFPKDVLDIIYELYK